MLNYLNQVLQTNIAAELVFIAILAVIGAKLFTLFHLPAPGVMGPMTIVGAFQVLGVGFPEFPLPLINAFQIVIGLFIGAKINHHKLADLRQMALPVLLIMGWTLFSTVIMALLIRMITSDLPTALFSAAPGGISEMTILALSFNSEVAIVSTFQFVRIVVIMSLIPILAKYFATEYLKPLTAADEATHSTATPNGYGTSEVEEVRRCYSPKSLGIIGAGIVGGGILLTLKLPGGGILGAALVLGVMNVLFEEEYEFPAKIFQFALLGIGASVGLEFSPLMMQKIKEMFFPIIVFSVVIVGSNLVMGMVIRRLTHWDLITSLLSSAPGGLSQMAVIGEELGGDTVKIGILQLVRVLTIISTIPVMAAIIS